MVKKVFSIVLCLTFVFGLFNTNMFALGIDSSESEMLVNTDTTVDGDIITVSFSIDSKYFFDNENTTFGLIYNLTPYALSSISYDKDSGYGGQLTSRQKNIYDNLVSYYISSDGFTCSENTDKLVFTPQDNKIPDIEDSAQEYLLDILYAYIAFVYDYPQVFWSSNASAGLSCIENSEDSTYNISISIELIEKYSGAKDEISQYNSGLISAVNEIMASVEDESPYGYYLAIHDWICEKSSYNYDSLTNPNAHPRAHSSSGIFVGDGSVVCQGYGEAFKVLCDYIRNTYNIELYTSMIVGFSDGGEAHMWNYAYLSDARSWYAIDACWDDQESGILYTYFLVGSNSQGFNKTFSQEHIENNNFSSESLISFTYPEISSDAYDKTDNICVEGIIISDGETTDPLTIMLIDSTGTVVDSTETTADEYILFAPAGEYTLEVSKKNHVTREYTVKISDKSVLLDIKLHLFGDIDGDGQVTILDVNKANLYAHKKIYLDEYELLCANVNYDSVVDDLDVKVLNSHYKNILKLW